MEERSKQILIVISLVGLIFLVGCFVGGAYTYRNIYSTSLEWGDQFCNELEQIKIQNEQRQGILGIQYNLGNRTGEERTDTGKNEECSLSNQESC